MCIMKYVLDCYILCALEISFVAYDLFERLILPTNPSTLNSSITAFTVYDRQQVVDE